MRYRKFVLPLTVSIASLFVNASCSHADSGQFSFKDAEFMPRQKGEEAARQFVAKQLPVDLPLTEAEARLDVATMKCNERQLNSGIVVCEYFEIVGSDGGTLGDDVWSVKLKVDSQRRIQSVAFNRSRSGFSSEGSQ